MLAWLEHRLAEQGQTIEEVVRAESQSQAADQASMANSIASLRFVNATEWHAFVETHSETEKILRAEPAGVYGRMDFATRDEYRHVVEALARRRGIDEEEVARTAVSLAAQRHAAQSDDVAAHVGYLLVDEGRRHLERALRGRRVAQLSPRRPLRGLKLLGYLGPVSLLTAVVAAPLVMQAMQGPGWLRPILALCAALAASQCAVAVVNWFASTVRKPRALPRMDFEHGIPDACRTMVVVPTLLTGRQRIAEIVEALELRYLANRDPNLWFALLTDFGDADSQHVEGDDSLLAMGRRRHRRAERQVRQRHARAILPVPPAPALQPAGRLLDGPRAQARQAGGFQRTASRAGTRIASAESSATRRSLPSIRYVITLDTDTDLPWGAGWRLVGAAAHPLNRPRMDTCGRRLVRGYAILQPRVSISLRSAAAEPLFPPAGRRGGPRPVHARRVGPVPGPVRRGLLHRQGHLRRVAPSASCWRGGFLTIPCSATICWSRATRAPASAATWSCWRTPPRGTWRTSAAAIAGCAATGRSLRGWVRGSRDAAGRRVHPWIAALGWWKIFDNLRRAFVAPAYVILLVLGWLVLPAPLAWTLWVAGLLFVPELLPGLAELLQRPAKLPLWVHATAVGRSTGRRLARTALWLTFLPFEAVVALDAAVRTMWRMLYSRQRLLEWQTAAAAESGAAAGVLGILQTGRTPPWQPANPPRRRPGPSSP